ncbi:putative gustatory receptor 28a [Bacillus rossius redtenbacheri]|uniref:putative gustatory receptor 28a n=1 Tax=Bacillus rossius redtenbacheri TaxID=93214 RepID=UPI002FDCEC62
MAVALLAQPLCSWWETFASDTGLLLYALDIAAHASAACWLILRRDTLTRLESRLSGFRYLPRELAGVRKLVACQAALVLAFVAVDARFFLFRTPSSPGSATSDLLYLWMVSSTYAVILNFNALVLLVRTQIGAANGELHRLGRGDPCGPVLPRRMDPAMETAVAQVAVARGALHEVVADLNSAFSIPLLTQVTRLFVQAVFCLYKILLSALGRKDEFSDTDGQASFNSVAHSCVFGVFIVYFLWQIVFICEQAVQEHDRTPALVHRIINKTYRKEAKQKLEEFSLQLLHSKIKFSACGFFPLDYSVIGSMVGAITTYLVVLVQFQLSSSEHVPANITNITNITK